MKDFENMKKTPEKLREFFDNPYMEEMLRSNNDMLNYSVMRIMSACELLEGGDGAKISDERRSYYETIRGMCRDLLRESAVNMAMFERGGKTAIMRTDRFLEDFAAGCLYAEHERITVRMVERSDSMVRCDSDLLRFIMLSVIRFALFSESSSQLEIGLGSKAEDGNVTIYMELGGPVSDKKNAGFCMNGFYVDNFKEICGLLSERMGIKTELTDNGISFTMKAAERTNIVEMKAPYLYFEKDHFSVFHIMLSDLENMR